MSLVDVTRTERVAVVTLNDPERRNALTLPMVHELVSAVEQLEADDEVGALVVTGAAPAFCAGADLGNLETATPEQLRGIYEGFLRIARSTLPTVAAVNGSAVGAGMNLALACDVRLAGSRAKFDTRFVDLGLHPGGGHTWMLRNAVGPSHAAAMVMFGQILDSRCAERIGLVWRAVEDTELLAEATTLAARAASGPKPLLAEVKRSLHDMAAITDHSDAVEREINPQVWSSRQPWFAQRMAALRARISGGSR